MSVKETDSIEAAMSIRFKPRRKRDHVADHFEETLRVAAHFAMDDARRTYQRLGAKCESEIERLLLSGFIRESLAGGDVRFFSGSKAKYGLGEFVDCELKTEPFTESITGIEPQVQIGPYRVDFLVLAARQPDDSIDTPDDQRQRVIGLVVECDGHDFHERTKEQAARDRARDRHMLMAGYHVMRFTGSEIWKDASACASQVIEFIDGRLWA